MAPYSPFLYAFTPPAPFPPAPGQAVDLLSTRCWLARGCERLALKSSFSFAATCDFKDVHYVLKKRLWLLVCVARADEIPGSVPHNVGVQRLPEAARLAGRSKPETATECRGLLTAIDPLRSFSLWEGGPST